MSERMKNIKALFTDSRTRLIILLTFGILILAIVVGFFILSSGTDGPETTAQVSRVPGGIQSVPGGATPTEQYAQLQEEENVSLAERAERTGGSAIPTIVRTQEFGEGAILGPTEGGVGFSTLRTQAREGGIEKALWLQQLREAECSQDAIETGLTEGLTWADVRTVCSCSQLKEVGYSIVQLRKICSCEELKDAGTSAEEFKAARYSASELRLCGFDACALRNAGYSARELCDAGYTPGELRGAGFSEEEIQAACRLPGGAIAEALRQSSDVGTLRRARGAGVSAAEARRLSGADAATLKEAGYSAQELRDAGFTAAELARAGFSAEELARAGLAEAQLLSETDAAALKEAGYSARELKDAGFTAAELARAGFSEAELQTAGFSTAELAQAGLIGAVDCSPAVLRQLRANGVTAREIREDLGCDISALKAAGYTAAELKSAGFTAAELAQAGFSAAELQAADFTVDQLREAGFDAGEVLEAGFDITELRDAGFTPEELRAANVSPVELQAAGFSANELAAAGFAAEALRRAGYDAAELKDAGFTANDLARAGFGAETLKQAGFEADDLKEAGFTANDLARAGFSANDLMRSGYDVDEVIRAGFSAGELQNVGISEAQLRSAGLQPLIAQAQVTQLGVVTTPGGIETLAVVPSVGGPRGIDSDDRLEQILAEQAMQFSAQQLEQDIAQRRAVMLGQMNTVVSSYDNTPIQFYDVGVTSGDESVGGPGAGAGRPGGDGEERLTGSQQAAMIKAGDIMFAVLDTSINSDEPGPVLATIVSGELKGAKLIGSLSLPREAQKVILSFNTMSLPDAARTISINAVAIDPDTARTALSDRTDNHYLLRYGSLFASSFLEGFGGSFADVGTTIEVDGTTTIVRDAGRSARESAYAGLGTVGERWGNQLAPIFNRPPTVEVFAGAGLGILFTQDVMPVK